ncbi:hypothetical protein CDD81_3381 [Ophiocordyceps australis]|uniref:Small ribosomal subunit protein uS7m n=1 Tax=Ophiocordyceps australis TaxID=1399860 RepID=A0A2C5XXI6_9HYPO|nr:hypothetical protein CDD81_3381 [Ophiocordyceps australis]
MSPRLRLWSACRALALRTRPPPAPIVKPIHPPRAIVRKYTDDANSHLPHTSIQPVQTNAKGPTEAAQETQSAQTDDTKEPEEVVEEAAATSSSFIDTIDDSVLEQMMYGGSTAPRFSKQALTPVQEETLYNEGRIPSADTTEETVAESSVPSSSDTESLIPSSQPRIDKESLKQAEFVPKISQRAHVQDTVTTPGHKFPLPQKPFPADFHLKKRYHPVLDQITRLIMRDGKLSVAQRNIALVLNHLRTSPEPKYNPSIPLLPGTPPASHLPLNPILYLTLALDSVAPLIRVRHLPNAGGGGRSLEVPEPLGIRQRRRIAFKWILNVVNKKPSRGSGRRQFPQRLAEELISIMEGRSGAWEKRRQVHKLGTTARANVLQMSRKK